MKTTFTTVDLLAIVAELKQRIQGMRVVQVYDIDARTYLIKLQKPDNKCILLLESGSRIHATDYEWPKSPAPSGFSMKLRKHLKNKRIESVEQLGVDRIVDLTFGSGDAQHHVIVELYDRGNIVLTDKSYNILNILRPRKEGEDVRFAVHEKYPVERARGAKDPPTLENLKAAVASAKDNTPLKKILNPLLDCGGGVIDHHLLEAGFPPSAKLGNHLKADDDLTQLHQAATKAQAVVTAWGEKTQSSGYIIKKVENRTKSDGTVEEVHIFEEFIPMLYAQYANRPHDKFPSFNMACDEFFSKMEAVKIDQKAMQQEKEALKKLANVKQDHMKRLQDLSNMQKNNILQGQLIELNKDLVEKAILVVRSLVANQIDWRQIGELLDEAKTRGDPVALSIKELKLEKNTIALSLSDPYDFDEDDLLLDSDEEREEGHESTKMRPMAVEIDLDISAMANARCYYDQKRQAAKKEQKTISASAKALQSAEKKTRQTLKEVAAITNINKARKVHWFEKFLWFISSENYLVIAGRDMQMNEMVVKRHLKPRDVYVHADLHGAASVVIKNPSGKEPPPKTLHEAGIMALCYSRAWDEKVVTSAWWVWGDQVSKTAQAGEYLTTGAFMVRGKKNFLPPSHLVYGFGFVFRLEEGSIARHAGERRIRSLEEDSDAKESLENLSINEEELILDDKDEEQENIIKEEDEEKDEEFKVENENVSMKEEDSEGEGDNEDAKDELEEDRNQSVEFPDTVVEIAHIGGDQFALRPRTVSTTSQISQSSVGGGEEEEDKVVYLGDDKPVQVNRNKNNSISKDSKGKKGKNRQDSLSNTQQNNKNAKQQQKEIDNNKGVPPKRGQKGKLKKIKAKYRDQDEEEREMRMQLLQSMGNAKESKKAKGNKKDIADDLNIVNALTAQPVAEDELLYAIPVCAPYSTMANYKYKVKLTPGPGKKGKACKTALALFMGDKTSTTREKDLLRAVRDNDLSKNLPGKVKVSAPNIHKVRK
ncbi:Serologically defined colon cancer antigen 1-like protein [Penaeus vannamei]|uniref:Serologically defined colon cancer antigen 1-like protein n=1 Tax=Penaeus vannamei TaxID=6689 RepID=A0A3R7MIT4_PENVA|nr:Serologically defined colon cancer antigen 1-like protein [Penaeus vannamei]